MAQRIWLIDLTSGARRLLVSVVGVSASPRWAPDEQAFAFRALTGRGGNAGLYQLRLDSDGPVRPVVEGNFNAYPIGWPASGGSFVWFRIAARGVDAARDLHGRGNGALRQLQCLCVMLASPRMVSGSAYAALESGLSEAVRRCVSRAPPGQCR